MRPESAAAIYSMDLAAERIMVATAGRNLQEFAEDWYFQSAVERQFEVLGEAMVRVRTLERAVFDRIPDAPKVVGLRNIIIHGYDSVDPEVLWSVAVERLEGLRAVLAELLDEARRQGL